MPPTDTQPTVFYSWQSDSPNSTNRSFIEKALELAIKEVAADLAVDIAPRLDDAAANVTGAEDIAATILRKIDQAMMFVGDVSLIGHATPTRPTPNPNVLVEAGYAIKALGPGRVILVFNEASGRIEDLPFDLRPRMTMKYSVLEGEPGVPNEQRSAARRDLGRSLAGAIKGILEKQPRASLEVTAEPTSLLERALKGVEDGAADGRARISDYMAWLAAQVAAHSPSGGAAQTDDDLVSALNDSVGLVTGFARLAEAIARHEADLSAVATGRGFESILQAYDHDPRKPGSFRSTDFDYAKFLGHELFVVFISALLRQEAWETIAKALDVDLCIDTNKGKQSRSWPSLSRHCALFQERKKRFQSHQLSLHADLLKERRTEGELATLSSFESFMEADYFLYLAAALHPPNPPFDPGDSTWRPWSLAYMSWVEPTFLARTQRRGFAQKLLVPLKLNSVELLRERYAERGSAFARMFDSFGMSVGGQMDPKLIASKP